MTNAEAMQLCRELRLVFDIVRLVDADLNIQYTFKPDGTLQAEKYACYAVWKKTQRCENCISALCMHGNTRRTKFEFIDSEVYNVVAQPLDVDGSRFVLEIVTHITDDTMFSAYGKSAFINLITSFNKKLYTDTLTGVYNRKYYDEHLCNLPGEVSAVVMLDLDDFKSVNDTYGHDAGDKALRAVGDALHASVRADDVLLRYGGDEFVLTFREISRKRLEDILQTVLKNVECIILPDYPALKLTVSIGGVYRKGEITDLILDADKMLYMAKEKKNNVCLSE